MYALDEIVAMNNAAVRKARQAQKDEGAYNRNCSYCGNAEKGVVLHSAWLRSTVFLEPGPQCNWFLAQWISKGAKGQSARNALVESYFS
jgi:hypothetical protein